MLLTNGVPGDEVEAQPLGKRRGVQRGKISSIVLPSDIRIKPVCPVAGECGGCALQFLEPDQHPVIKSAWVEGAFKSLMHDDTEWLPICADGMHPRRRLRWHVGCDEEGKFLGFFSPLSHRAVRQNSCMVITEPLQALHNLLELQDLSDLDQVEAVQLADGLHVVFESNQRPSLELPEDIDNLVVQGWWRNKGISRPLTRPVKRLHDILPVGDDRTVKLEIGPDAFVQGQFEGNHALISQIQIWAGKPRRVADLFCGAGNLSLPLAVTTGASVFGAELSQASVSAASRNAKLLGVNGHFVTANLFDDFDYESYIGADVLILDAPRRGAKHICNGIQQLMPKKIIMVSCDIASGARDGALLSAHGYRLRALRALDMFAYAGHVEAISLWES